MSIQTNIQEVRQRIAATPLSKPHGHAILLTSVPSSTLLYL